MTDPTEAEIEAACTAWITAPGKNIRDWMPVALLAAAEARRASATETLPCDVMLPPATRIGAGCSVHTLLTAIERRREMPPQPFTVFDRAVKAEAERDAYKSACKSAGICMSCVLGSPDPMGCTDCLGTGWDGGDPREQIKRVECERDDAREAQAELRRLLAEQGALLTTALEERDKARESQAWQDACATVAFREREALRAEVARLTGEQDAAHPPRDRTHAESCWSWGRAHYECALARIAGLEAEVARLEAHIAELEMRNA